MKTIILRRIFKSEKGTLGIFIINDVPLFLSLEPAACIDAGSYQCELYNSPARGVVYLLKNVPNKTYIEIHVGNSAEDTSGCILIGRGFSMIAESHLYISESQISFDRFIAKMKKEPFTLTIEEKF